MHTRRDAVRGADSWSAPRFAARARETRMAGCQAASLVGRPERFIANFYFAAGAYGSGEYLAVLLNSPYAAGFRVVA
jgi:hypothetical protein